MHHVAVQRWPRAILGKQRDLSGMLTALVERFDGLAPCRSLVVIDRSQKKHMPLHRAPAGYTAVFNDAPVAVLLAVLAANLVAQKHEARLPKPPAVSQATWSAPHAFSAAFLVLLLRFSVTYRRRRTAKFPELPASCESRAIADPRFSVPQRRGSSVGKEPCRSFTSVNESLVAGRFSLRPAGLEHPGQFANPLADSIG